MDEKLFWELIDRLRTAAFLLGREVCTENQRAVEAVRAELQEWLEATAEHFADPSWMDPTSWVPNEIVETPTPGGKASE